MKITLNIFGKIRTFKVKRNGDSIIINKAKILIDSSKQHIKSAFINNKKIEFGWIKNREILTIILAGRKINVQVSDRRVISSTRDESKNGTIVVRSPIPGLITAIHKKAGDNIKTGDPILTLNAMKMHNEVTSPKDGIIDSIHVTAGSAVEKDQLLFTIS